MVPPPRTETRRTQVVVSPAAADAVVVSKSPSRSFRYEAEDCLAQSLLIFLWADLRRLSTQGRIHTCFETLTVASDDAVKNTAARWSGRDLEELQASTNPGLSPAHIMAALLVEMRRAVLDQKNSSMVVVADDSSDVAAVEESSVLEALMSQDGDVSLLDDLDTNLQAYSAQLLRDLRGSTTAPDGDDGDDDDDDWQEMFSEMTKKREKPSSAGSSGAAVFSLPSSADDKAARVDSNMAEFAKLGDKIFAMGTEEAATIKGDTNALMTENELLDYMQEALVSRKEGSLHFLSALFKDDTTSQLAVMSKAKFVWMNDWHPTSDLLYAVSVDQALDQVTIIFRGAQNEADFNICKDTELIEVPNPVQENYQNKTDTIQVHAGYYKYLFRRRKDTGICKYDEIVNIMTECASRIGKDYRVVVTGLSLGAALSHVFSLFASADPRFRRNGPLKVYTFGGPMTLGRTAADCYHHQEATRKLQLARFYNVRDCITHFPPNPDGLYKHPGIKIKLHRPRPRALWGSSLPPVRKPEVSYDWIPSTAPNEKHKQQAWPDLFWFNLPLPWNVINVHLLPEHQRRALFARAVCREDDPDDATSLADLYQEFVYSKYPEAS